MGDVSAPRSAEGGRIGDRSPALVSEWPTAITLTAALLVASNQELMSSLQGVVDGTVEPPPSMVITNAIAVQIHELFFGASISSVSLGPLTWPA